MSESAAEPTKITLFNTLSRRKETFVPLEPGEILLYCCGPTVYDYAHVGNLRTYVFEDVLLRCLLGAGYRVKHVMNITDVGHLQSDADFGEDKMVVASEREGRSPWDIARFYEEAFLKDCEALNIRRPALICRATDHIKEIIRFVEELVAKGAAYEIDGNVYFDTAKARNYNNLRGGKELGDAAVSRVEEDPRKRNPADFVLWFSQSKFPRQIMKWESPWGVGFPGWHIECSVMASKYLGPRIDIHCGGTDHIPVHHTNEIAQSEAYFGHVWVNYWMHGAFLVVDKGKMSKSAGDFLTLQGVKDRGFKPLHYRYLCLGAHYRSELFFSWEALDGARRSLENLYNRIVSWKLSAPPQAPSGEETSVKEYQTAFWRALADDLNAPVALSVLWAVAKDTVLGARTKLALVEEFDLILGLDLPQATRPELTSDLMELIRQRQHARESGEWGRADELRNRLAQHGVMVKDTNQGPEWYLKESE